MFQVPQHQGGFRRLRLQEQREEDVERAEPDAILAQLRARRLIERLHLLVDRLAAHDAEILHHAERDAARETGHILGLGDLYKRLQALGDDFGQPRVEAFKHLFLVGRAELLICLQLQRWLQRIVAGHQGGDHIAAPKHLAFAAEFDRIGLGRRDAARAHGQFLGQHVRCRRTRGLALQVFGLCLWMEHKAFEAADKMVLDLDRAILGDLGGHLILVAQALDQGAGLAIDKALREADVQRIRQLVLDVAGARLPFGRVLQPVIPVGDKRPRADMS